MSGVFTGTRRFFRGINQDILSLVVEIELRGINFKKETHEEKVFANLGREFFKV
jgi:hypothetical protein